MAPFVGAGGIWEGVTQTASLFQGIAQRISELHNVWSVWLRTAVGADVNSLDVNAAEETAAKYQAYLQMVHKFAEEFGPEAAAVMKDLLEYAAYVHTGGALGNATLNPQTRELFDRTTAAVNEIITAIGDEWDGLSEEEKIGLVSRLSGAILFEVAAATATGGAALAVRAGKLKKLLDGFGVLSQETVLRIERIVGKFLKKADSDANQSARPLIPIIQSTCFVAGTPILTPSGAKRIEEFRAGDAILSRPEDEVGAPVRTSVVEEVFRHSAPIMQLVLAGQAVGTTAEHPFYVATKGWTAAKHLQPGDLLMGHDSTLTAVESITFSDQFQTVYNLRVAFDHTYFVGGDDWGFSVWAHNTYSIVTTKVIKNGNEIELYVVRKAGQPDMEFNSREDMLKFYGKENASELLDYLNGNAPKGAPPLTNPRVTPYGSNKIRVQATEGVLDGKITNGDLYIEMYQVRDKFLGNHYGTSLIREAIENGGRKVTSVSGTLGGRNSTRFDDLGDIWQTPIGRAMKELGFDKVRLDGDEFTFWR